MGKLMVTTTIHKVNQKDIELVKNYIDNYAMYKRDCFQFCKWNALLLDLCKLHKVEDCTLIIDPNIGCPCYLPEERLIKLNKCSMISLLHEFAHHIKLGEEEAIQYSEGVFLSAYPKAKKYLIRNEKGYLVKK